MYQVIIVPTDDSDRNVEIEYFDHIDDARHFYNMCRYDSEVYSIVLNECEYLEGQHAGMDGTMQGLDSSFRQDYITTLSIVDGLVDE